MIVKFVSGVEGGGAVLLVYWNVIFGWVGWGCGNFGAECVRWLLCESPACGYLPYLSYMHGTTVCMPAAAYAAQFNPRLTCENEDLAHLTCAEVSGLLGIISYALRPPSDTRYQLYIPISRIIRIAAA